MNHRTLLLCGVCGLASIVAETAVAQSPPKSEAAIEEIVVTARKTTERIQDVPIAITAVTSSQLRDLTVRDVVDVQKLAPGLYISSQGSGGRAKLTIRGQHEADSLLTTDGSVGVYVDGVNIARSLGLRTAFLDIAQVEVLKGPQGTLFGRNTTGGALIITTKQPRYEYGGYVDLLYGNYNNRQAIAAANVPLIDQKLAARVVVQTISRDGYGHNPAGTQLGDDHTNAFVGHILYDPTNHVRLTISGDYSAQRNGLVPMRPTFNNMATCCNSAGSSLGQIAYELGLNPSSAADRATALAAWNAQYNAYFDGSLGRYDSKSAAPSRDEFSQGGGSATLEWDLGKAKFKSVTAYREMGRNTLQDLDLTSFNLVDSQQLTKSRNYSEEVQLASIPGGGLDWQVGGFWNRELGVDGAENAILPAVSVLGGSAAGGNQFAGQLSTLGVQRARIRNESYAVYGQANYRLSDHIRVTAGLRYTHDLRGMDNQNQNDRTRTLPGVPLLPYITPGNCDLLDPDYGGPVWPNCHKPVSVSFNAVTYLASIDWRPREGLMFYASTSKGYRSGGWTLRANSNLITGATREAALAAEAAAFRPFRPEFVVNYEGGFKSDWFDRRLRVNGAVFYQDYKDIQQQVRVFEGPIVTTRISNAAQASIYGTELEATALLSDRLELHGGFSYLHARYGKYLDVTSGGVVIDRSSQPFAAPEWTDNLDAVYTVPLHDGSLKFTANYNWIDAVNFLADATLTPAQNAALTQKAYGLLDARVTWAIESQQLELSIWAHNLGDTAYYTATNNLISLGLALGFQGDPRTFGVQVRKTWGGG